MQEEIHPFLRMMTPVHREFFGKQRIYRFPAGERLLCLVQSGVGPANAASATRLLIDRYRPELIINFGFAGSLSPEHCTGDIVVADRLLSLHKLVFTERHGLSGELSRAILPEAARTTFITTEKVTSKKELAAGLPQEITRAVVEMETGAVAQIAHREKIPLVAVRAISDSYDDELGFSLEEFCDTEMNLQKRRVGLTIVKKPWILPQLIRLAGNSRSASGKLAEAVSAIISGL